SDQQVDWALATRFQADRDLVVASGFRTMPLDPSLGGQRTGAKAGFDCTKPFGETERLDFMVPEPPWLAARELTSISGRLAEGPASFRELMEAIGTRDGREVLRELAPLYESGRLARTDDGRYSLRSST